MHFHGCWRICNHSQTFTFKLKIKMRETELFKESQDSYQFAHLTRESVLMWLFTHSLADNRGHDRGSWCLPQALPSFCPQEVSLQESARYTLKYLSTSTCTCAWHSLPFHISANISEDYSVVLLSQRLWRSTHKTTLVQTVHLLHR